MSGRTVKRIVAIIAWLLLTGNAYAATTQLPPGQVCFVISGGAPAVNGSLNMYFPSTTTPKTTWTTSTQSATNTNPIQLDANGCAIIYGIGTYRQQLYDGPVVGGMTTGNLIFDLPTTDTSAYNSVFWASLAGGTPNVITIVDTGFNATDGTVINFLALSTNTGATTINPSGYGAISVEKLTTAGPVSLIGGEIVQNNVISVVYSATLNAFLLINPPIQSASGNSAPSCSANTLKISVSSNTAIAITANSWVTTNTSGSVYNRTNLSLTLNASTVGVNGLSTDISGGTLASSTWYYVWAIDNGSAGASVLSSSSTAPVLPAGYTTECRLGAVTTDSSADLMRIVQLGKHAQYIVGTDPANVIIVANGVAGTYSVTSPILAPVAITGNSNSLPPTASVFYGIAEGDWKAGGGSPSLEVAPNSNWGGTNNGPGGSNGNVYPVWIVSSSGIAYQFSMVLESGNIYWACSGTYGALGALGWDDQVNAN